MITNTFEDPLRELQCDGHSNLNNIMRFRKKCGFPLRQMVLEKPHKRFRKDETPLEWFAPLSVLEEKSCAAFALYVVVQSENNWFAAVPESILVPSEPLRALKKVQLQHGSIDILNRTFVNNNNETLECSHLNRLQVGDRIQVFDVVETKIKDDWIATVKEYAVIERTFTYSSAVAVKKRGGEGVHTVYPIDSKLAQILPGAPFSSNLRGKTLFVNSAFGFVPKAPIAPNKAPVAPGTSSDIGIKDETKETTSDTVTIETRRTVKREGKIHFEEATTICFPRVLPSNVHIIKAQILPVPQ
ncbi:hypothetical protein CRE_21087 [Caenorhabditis remanei]|uniref:Uncharacterized protein n=1 Tax=Caenorhabditis remanei TaxID=31234 RepID=E3NTA3_CAERE|nr:hypothetical protein CRE_21087 [Caenorhabditis remanei]